MFGICHLSAVPCRKEPSDKGEMVTQLLFGDLVQVLEKKENWHLIRIEWDGYECWVDQKQYLPVSKTDYETVLQSPIRVSTELFQFVHDTEKKYSFPIGPGCSIPFLENQNCRIGQTNFGYEGETRLFSEKAVRDSIVETALLFQHTPYLWGGKTPFGIDCSGFTQLVFKANGIRLLRDAYQQAEFGEAYSFAEEAQPGDLAFFDNAEGRIVHVGIVIGENQIIHASGRVRIDHFDHYGIFTPERGGYTHNLRLIKKVM
jgi:gamma-D-glutamyl-L-lysine dipeptidyl-peptidase